MSSIRLHRIDLAAAQHDPWIKALIADYEIPQAPHVFAGRGLEDNERVAFFIGKDGGGIGFIDRDPEGYIETSKRIAEEIEYERVHGLGTCPPSQGWIPTGPEEYEFEEGSFNYNAREIVQEANMSLF